MSANRAASDHDKSRRGGRFATGRVLAGRYELLEPVGEGGTAEVFRTIDHRLERIVAVKVLRPEFGQDANARTRFAVEARSAAALNVPNIVPVYDFGAADDGSLFIVMRYIDGPSLRRILGAHGSLSVAAALDVARQIAEALAAAHAHGLIHRDVKPGNVLIDQEGTAHLADFGTVKALAGSEDLTRSGTIFGTAAYLSPEQATGGQIGPYTDIYALGVVLYEALSGQPPFLGEDPVAVSYRHAHELPRPLSGLVPGLASEINDLVMACLAKAPGRRPADAARVASTLDIAGRRIAPRGDGRRQLSELATGLGAAGATAALGRAATVSRGDPETETAPLPTSPYDATTVESARPTPIPPQPIGAATQSPAQSPPRPQIERGVVVQPGWQREPARSRGGGAIGAIVLIAVFATVVAVSAFVIATWLSPNERDPGVGFGATPTASAGRPRATQPAVVITAPVTVAPTDPPITAQPPTASPVAPEPATAPPAPTPTPTDEPATAPPGPTPTPTEVPPPAPTDVTFRIADGLFVGDFHGPDNGTYHGSSASWIYGQGTPYHTMTATFELDPAGRRVGRAALELVGLDGENPAKNTIRVALNGVVLYDGPNPLPNDFCCGGSGPGNWGSVVFEFPADLLADQNSLSISNLEANDCTSCPKFVMVDYAVLAYRARS